MKWILQAIEDGVYWGVDRAVRLLVFAGMIWVVNWLVPAPPDTIDVKLVDATVGDLARGMARHVVFLLVLGSILFSKTDKTP
jgi:hypothetical protein